MSLEDKIGGLFEEAEEELNKESKNLESFLFEDGEMPEEVKDFDLDALEVEIKKAQPKEDGLEKREFYRAEVGHQEIALNFSNQYQFARQYIDNISLGGLFVKTTEKRALGDFIDIAFSLPILENELRDFSLKAKVCRVTKDGLGLEFTNLDAETQTAIENYVRKVLPAGMSVKAKAKQSTLDRLQALREQKAVEKKALKSTIKATLAISFLVLVNTTLLVTTVSSSKTTNVTNSSKFKIEDRVLSESEVKSVMRDENGQVVMQLNTNERIPIRNIEELPYNFRHDVQLTKSLSSEKPRRKNKNAGGLTRIGH